MLKKNIDGLYFTYLIARLTAVTFGLGALSIGPLVFPLFGHQNTALFQLKLITLLLSFITEPKIKKKYFASIRVVVRWNLWCSGVGNYFRW